MSDVFQQTIEFAPVIALSGFAVYLLLLADKPRPVTKSANMRLHAASRD